MEKVLEMLIKSMISIFVTTGIKVSYKGVKGKIIFIPEVMPEMTKEIVIE